MAGTDDNQGNNKEALSFVDEKVTDSSKAIPVPFVTEQSLVCLQEMFSVRGFFVGNLLTLL